MAKVSTSLLIVPITGFLVMTGKQWLHVDSRIRQVHLGSNSFFTPRSCRTIGKLSESLWFSFLICKMELIFTDMIYIWLLEDSWGLKERNTTAILASTSCKVVQDEWELPESLDKGHTPMGGPIHPAFAFLGSSTTSFSPPFRFRDGNSSWLLLTKRNTLLLPKIF